MAPLNTAFAVAAPADVDIELAVDGLARDLDLVLLGYMRLVERATAIGAVVWQRRIVDLVNLLGAGRLAVGLGAVVLTRLAARLAGVRLRLALGERPCLALAGTEGRVELTAKPLILGLQLVDSSL
jgi:hypothetical protein